MRILAPMPNINDAPSKIGLGGDVFCITVLSAAFATGEPHFQEFPDVRIVSKPFFISYADWL